MRAIFLFCLLFTQVGSAKALPAGLVSAEPWREGEELGIVVRGTLAQRIYETLSKVEEKIDFPRRLKQGIHLACQLHATDASENVCGLRLLADGTIGSVTVPLTEAERAYTESKLGWANLDQDASAAILLNVKNDIAVTTLGFLGQQFPAKGLMRMEQGDTNCSMYRGTPGRGGIYRPRIRKCTFRFGADGRVVR